MKASYVIAGLTVALLLALGACNYEANQLIKLGEQSRAAQVTKTAEVGKLETKSRTKAFALARMEQVKSKLSPLRRDILSTQISEVASKVFEDREDHAQAFVTVLAIESGFNKFAQSPTGPRGLGQVAKGAFAEGLKSCTKLAFNDEDVWDVEVNLLASGCYFKSMLAAAGGNPYVAIVSYNQGGASNDSKNFKKTGSLDGKEPLQYLAKFVFLSNPKLAVQE